MRQNYSIAVLHSSRHVEKLSFSLPKMSLNKYCLPKLRVYVPLWRRWIPRYPLIWQGGPQLRIFLPLFWMKLIRPKEKLPPDTVNFEVHPQMTRHDVKQYLEKIYKVPVQNVRTHRLRGKDRTHPVYGYSIGPGPDIKVAYVQLAEGQTFEYPDLFKKGSPQEKELKNYEEASKEMEKDLQKSWDKSNIPSWFR